MTGRLIDSNERKQASDASTYFLSFFSPHRSPPRSSPSMNQQLLPPPAVITQMSSNPSIPSSHHSQQQAALLTAQQILASQGVYPQDLIASGLFPYASYHGSLPTAPSPFLLDPRFMHEYASSAVANSEQFKGLVNHSTCRINCSFHSSRTSQRTDAFQSSTPSSSSSNTSSFTS